MKATLAMKAAVKAGVAYLNVTDPNWFWRINPETLDLSQPCHCILGQLEQQTPDGGNYNRACTRRNLIHPGESTERVMHLGFTLGTVFGSDQSRKWQALTELWKQEIRNAKRRNR